MNFTILWIPVIISTILFMPLGAFIYSEKGLGKAWLKAINKTAEDIKNESTNMGLIMGATILISLVTVIIFSILFSSIGIMTILDLFLLTLFVYGILFLIRLKNVLFDGNFALLKINLISTLGEFVIIFIVFMFFV